MTMLTKLTMLTMLPREECRRSDGPEITASMILIGQVSSLACPLMILHIV